VSTVVIKLGGRIFESEVLAAVCSDVAELTKRGDRVVLVHGGGPQATRMQERLGLPTHMVAGRRVTDSATLDVIKMVVGGKLNIDLCAALLRAGASPVGLSGASALTVRAGKRPPRVMEGAGPDPVDFGWVGDVEGINEALVATLLSSGYTPVIACIGASESGDIFNINGDVVANYVASGLRADHLVLVTSVPGVLRDIDDPQSRIRTITAAEARAAVADGSIKGGMIPKVTESIAGLERGVGAIHIVGDLGAGQLRQEIDTPGALGTAVIGTRGGM